MLEEENNTLTTNPTVELVTELSKLEQEIDLKIMKYNLLRAELIRRFPITEIEETFKPKILVNGGNNERQRKRD